MEFVTALGNWCGGPGFWHAGGGGGWIMPFHFGGILPLLVLGLIIYFTARLFQKQTRTVGPDSAEKTLRERFAMGEIDAQTYETMREKLRK